MSRLISEKYFNRLEAITKQLQTLTIKDSEIGLLVDELDRILLDSDIEEMYREFTREEPTPRTKTHGAAYIV